MRRLALLLCIALLGCGGFEPIRIAGRDAPRTYTISESDAKANPEIVKGFEMAAERWSKHGHPTRLQVGGWGLWRVVVVDEWNSNDNPCRTTMHFDGRSISAFSSGRRVCFMLSKGEHKIHWKLPRDCDAPGELNAYTAALHELGHQYGYSHVCATREQDIKSGMPRCGPEHDDHALNANVTCKTREILP